MSFLLNHKPVDALALIVHMSAAAHIGQTWVKKLSQWCQICHSPYPPLLCIAKVIPRQLFELAIQAMVCNKVVARGNLSAIRKDVTAGLYGGHHERKLKHLENQKVWSTNATYISKEEAHPPTLKRKARSEWKELRGLLTCHRRPSMRFSALIKRNDY